MFLYTVFVRSEDRVDEAAGGRYPLVEDRIQAEIMHHIRDVDELLAAFRRDEEPLVHARAGHRALELAYAAIESFGTGRRVATA